jgi:hypothetical protein
MEELYPKRGIAKEDLPPFLQTWLDRTSPDWPTQCIVNAYVI